MLQLKQVTKQIGSRKILDGLNLQVDKGEAVGLVGANGAGKTTLFSLISTVAPLTKGDILVNGYSVRTQTKEARKYIGYAPQEIALYTSLTVWDNLSFFARLSPVSVRREQILQVAAQLGLSNCLSERVANLSGGYKRRVNMAVALLHHPPLLLLDEPTVGVDIYARRDFLSLMNKWKEEGTTIIYSSHDAEEISYLADRVVMLEAGKIVFDGSIERAKKELDILQRVK